MNFFFYFLSITKVVWTFYGIHAAFLCVRMCARAHVMCTKRRATQHRLLGRLTIWESWAHRHQNRSLNSCELCGLTRSPSALDSQPRLPCYYREERVLALDAPAHRHRSPLPSLRGRRLPVPKVLAFCLRRLSWGFIFVQPAGQRWQAPHWDWTLDILSRVALHEVENTSSLLICLSLIPAY